MLSDVTKGGEAANKVFFSFLEIYRGIIQNNWPCKAAKSWMRKKGQNIGRLWDL